MVWNSPHTLQIIVKHSPWRASTLMPVLIPKKHSYHHPLHNGRLSDEISQRRPQQLVCSRATLDKRVDVCAWPGLLRMAEEKEERSVWGDPFKDWNSSAECYQKQNENTQRWKWWKQTGWLQTDQKTQHKAGSLRWWKGMKVGQNILKKNIL